MNTNRHGQSCNCIVCLYVYGLIDFDEMIQRTVKWLRRHDRK